MEKIQLVETFTDLPSVSNVDEAITNEVFDTPETKEKLKRVDGKYIIGMIEGQFFKPDGMSRNGRFYPRELWENVLNDNDVRFAFDNQNMFGEIGHSEGPIDDYVLRRGEASHFIDKLWIDEDGRGMGRAFILNTPVGQFLKTYMGAGCKLKVSTRGAGTFLEGRTKDGCPVIDPNSYELQTVDFVVHPGFLETNPVLRESYDKLLKEDKNRLNIDKLNINESTLNKGDDTMTLDAQSFVEDLKAEKSELKTEVSALRESLIAKDKELVNAQLNESKIVSLNETIESLKKERDEINEALEKEKQNVADLNEQLSAYTEKAGTLEELNEATELSTKAVLALSKYQELGSVKSLQAMKEELEAAKSEISEIEELKGLSKKAIQRIKESKKLEAVAEKAHAKLKEYYELGSLAELKQLKESATKIVETRQAKKSAADAKALSEEFKCPIESAVKLIKKHGLAEAKEILETVAPKAEAVQEPEKTGNLVEEAVNVKPESEPAQKFLKKGLLSDLKAADFNKEALGKETSEPLLSVKPLNPFITKKSSDYGNKFVGTEKGEGEVKVDDKELTPEQAEKAAKAAQK